MSIKNEDKRRKTIVFTFGEIASGKSYLGSQLSNELKCAFIEGDNYLPGFNKLIGAFLSVDGVMKFIKNNLIPAICETIKVNDMLIVSYAFYIKDQREFVTKYLSFLGYDVKWIYVNTPSEDVQRNLQARSYWFMSWTKFSELNNKYLEKPNANESNTFIFNNSTDKDKFNIEMKKIISSFNLV